MSKPSLHTQKPSLFTFLSPLSSFFHFAKDALTLPFLPIHVRLRLLLFQPFVLLIYSVNHILCHLCSPRPPSTIHIPLRNRATTRALLYLPPQQSLSPPKQSIPIHIDLPGGAFVSSQPESNHRFCQYLARHGFIVISASYRFAPRYPFPAALEDVSDVVEWVLINVRTLAGAAGVGDGGDGEGHSDRARRNVSIGGSSAGGSLAIAAAGLEGIRGRIDGVVSFYAPIDLTIPPSKKPRPADFPRFDPASIFLPLFDLYAKSGREAGFSNDARLSPCLATGDQVPERLLMVVPTIDILVKEQLEFVERVNEERKQSGREGVECLVMERCFHGWLELPSMFIDEETRSRVFEECVEFLKGRD